MKRTLFCIATCLAVTGASAEIYQWKDANGRTVMSDKPPASVQREVRKIDAEAPASASTAPASAADRELAFRKRRQETQEKAEKDQRAQAEASENKANCERARSQLQVLESGERVALRDSQGERYFLDDAQREQEIVRARQAVQSLCK
ncbi:DUF4124 domain-containing protein [Rhodocyclus tenuis]|uniref:Putative membrane protein YccC n=1 Tax=Rhodocyclus tenuis TaxID=1066 RepID=A0A840G580_RHOTE|nr:DUF4124 domain-containing protein [Rhodocyclus tenuis]MBB4247086.1 putative membrane protein YccC [Rhodocyclus tenuis]